MNEEDFYKFYEDFDEYVQNNLFKMKDYKKKESKPKLTLNISVSLSDDLMGSIKNRLDRIQKSIDDIKFDFFQSKEK